MSKITFFTNTVTYCGVWNWKGVLISDTMFCLKRKAHSPFTFIPYSLLVGNNMTVEGIKIDAMLVVVTKYRKFTTETITVWLFFTCYADANSFLLLHIYFRYQPCHQLYFFSFLLSFFLEGMSITDLRISQPVFTAQS